MIKLNQLKKTITELKELREELKSCLSSETPKLDLFNSKLYIGAESFGRAVTEGWLELSAQDKEAILNCEMLEMEKLERFLEFLKTKTSSFLHSPLDFISDMVNLPEVAPFRKSIIIWQKAVSLMKSWSPERFSPLSREENSDLLLALKLKQIFKNRFDIDLNDKSDKFLAEQLESGELPEEYAKAFQELIWYGRLSKKQRNQKAIRDAEDSLIALSILIDMLEQKIEDVKEPAEEVSKFLAGIAPSSISLIKKSIDCYEEIIRALETFVPNQHNSKAIKKFLYYECDKAGETYLKLLKANVIPLDEDEKKLHLFIYRLIGLLPKLGHRAVRRTGKGAALVEKLKNKRLITSMSNYMIWGLIEDLLRRNTPGISGEPGGYMAFSLKLELEEELFYKPISQTTEDDIKAILPKLVELNAKLEEFDEGEKISLWAIRSQETTLACKILNQFLSEVIKKITTVQEKPAKTERNEKSDKEPENIVSPPKHKWEDIYIEVIDGHNVKVKIDNQVYDKNFSDLGFADNRCNPKKPNKLWNIFLSLAEKSGGRRANAVDITKYDIKRIRRTLESHFNINESPISDYLKGCWPCKFKFNDPRSY